ncbi:MAG: protein kinase, partial [Bacteroidota bacterium]
VFFVPLATFLDAGLVSCAVVQTLGIPESGTQTPVENLKEYLKTRNVLLLLDNFEQVIDAAPIIARLLAGCPRLKIIVTSRTVLHLSGEHEYPVQPLSLPDLKNLPHPKSLSQYAAVELFIQRALAVKPDFAVTNENAAAVAEICARLDGLPLAVELAAARIKLFSPQALLSRLGSRLDILKGGARDVPQRHQTLRQAIAWSYDLLSDDERKLFRRLAVFTGGWTLEGTEAICNSRHDIAVDILDGIAALVDKSLVRQVDAGGGLEA